LFTKKVFKDLAIFMIGFGIIMGIVFPFFVVAATNVSAEIVFTPLFFAMCIAAGFLVGLFNIFLARKIVGKKLTLLAQHMGYVEKRLIEKANNHKDDVFDDERCYINIDSEDVIGDCAKAFNALVKSLCAAFKSENAVKKFSEMLSSRLEIDQLANDALNKLIDNFNAVGGAIIIEKEGDLSVVSSFGIDMPQEMIKDKVIWHVIKNQKRILLDFPENVTLNGVLVKYKPKTILIEPILYKEIALGVVVLATVEESTNEMQNNMQLFGQGLALAFKNAITHDQLQRLAANDPLTGIFNRRFGLLRLKEEFSRAIKNNTPLGVIMFDIDHFKEINDTYGHLVGDKVLVSLAKAAKMALREGDIFMRYGGEEFLIVLPGASISDITQIAERLRHIVEDTEIHNYLQTIKITISIGGTSYPEHNVDDYLSLINITDKKLFQAKDSGRNILIVN
jgi:two-component system cell cycle response regulator